MRPQLSLFHSITRLPHFQEAVALELESAIARKSPRTLLDTLAQSDLELSSVDITSQQFCKLLRMTEGSYPGPSTPNFADLHPDAQGAFRSADEAYWRATGNSHLQIESGFRTVYRQAELFACWQLGQAGCNPADIPGASIHNYGQAIDIRDSGNPAVVAALDNNGWDRTHNPPEPWHWEPVGQASHTAAVQRRQEMRAAGSVARRWQSEWTSAKTKNEQRNSKIENFNQRLAVWQPHWEQLRIDVEAFDRDVARHNTDVTRWQSQRDTFNQRVDRHNQEVTALQALRARIEQMEPSPERDRLIQDYNSRTDAANAERSSIVTEQERLSRELSQLQREANDLTRRRTDVEQRYATLTAERDSLLRLRDEIERLKQEIDTHLATSRNILDEIARQVHP